MSECVEGYFSFAALCEVHGSPMCSDGRCETARLEAAEAEVERLTAERNQARAYNIAADQLVGKAEAEVERLTAELERVTAREIAADEAMRDEAEKRKERDRRIAAALALIDAEPSGAFVIGNSHREITRILRGDS